MADWTETLKALAPTVASALLGPLSGTVVAAIGSITGLEKPTKEQLIRTLQDGILTPEHITQIKEFELKCKAEEAERGFRYADLEFKDRDSARTSNVAGGTQKALFWMSLLLLSVCFGAELRVLFWGYPTEVVDALLVGRILGLMDATAAQIMAYWYGSTSGSMAKTSLLAQSNPAGK